jgi:hypothetical protein
LIGAITCPTESPYDFQYRIDQRRKEQQIQGDTLIRYPTERLTIQKNLQESLAFHSNTKSWKLARSAAID